MRPWAPPGPRIAACGIGCKLWGGLVPRRGEEEEVELDEDEDDDLDEVERAVLLVRRTLSEERPLEGKPVTVTVELYNAGVV